MKSIAYYTVKTISIFLTTCLIAICLIFGYLYYCNLVKMEVPTLGPFKIFVVISGSMEPVMKVDDAVIINTKIDPAKLMPGDIITFTAYESDVVNTHRITNKELTANGYEFKTKGDNTNVEDPYITPQSRIIGKCIMCIPKLKVFLDGALAKPYLVAVMVVLILLVQFLLGALEKKFNPASAEIAASAETDVDSPQIEAEDQQAAPLETEQQQATLLEAEEQQTTLLEAEEQQIPPLEAEQLPESEELRQFQGIFTESWNNGNGSASDEKEKN
jgi:signal peptidase